MPGACALPCECVYVPYPGRVHVPLPSTCIHARSKFPTRLPAGTSWAGTLPSLVHLSALLCTCHLPACLQARHGLEQRPKAGLWPWERGLPRLAHFSGAAPGTCNSCNVRWSHICAHTGTRNLRPWHSQHQQCPVRPAMLTHHTEA